LKFHTPTEDKIDDMTGSFCEELERVFDRFPTYEYHMQMLLGEFNAKAGREDIFKPTIGNESLHEISNDNGVKVKFSPLQALEALRVVRG
jgi:predicted ester cyclase